MISSVKNNDAQFENFTFNNFKFVKKFIKSFAKNEKYETLKIILRIFNKFSKIENYVINITKIDRSRVKIKNKMYLNCNREKKFKNENTDKRNVVSKRIDCLFHVINVFNEKNKYIFHQVLNSIYNHDRLQKNDHVRNRRYFMTFKIRENLKFKHKIKIKSKKILNFIRNKYDDKSFNNSIIDSKNIYNALSLIREQKLKNIIAIQILNHELHNNFDK